MGLVVYQIENGSNVLTKYFNAGYKLTIIPCVITNVQPLTNMDRFIYNIAGSKITNQLPEFELTPACESNVISIASDLYDSFLIFD